MNATYKCPTVYFTHLVWKGKGDSWSPMNYF